MWTKEIIHYILKFTTIVQKLHDLIATVTMLLSHHTIMRLLLFTFSKHLWRIIEHITKKNISVQKCNQIICY